MLTKWPQQSTQQQQNQQRQSDQQQLQQSSQQQSREQKAQQQQQQSSQLHLNEEENSDGNTETGGRRLSAVTIPSPNNEGQSKNVTTLNWNMVNSLPLAMPPVSSQGGQSTLTRSQDGQEEFDLMADLSSFDYDILTSDFTDMDGMFDILPGSSLLRDEDMQADVTHETTSHNNYQPDPAVGVLPHATPSKRPLKRSSSMQGHLRPSFSRGRWSFSSSVQRKISQHNSLSSPSADVVDSGSSERPAKRGYNQGGVAHDRLSKFQLQSSTDKSCSGQCHAIITEQLSCLNEWLSEERDMSIDILLRIDTQICREREKVLNCPACLGKTRSRQTLMVIIMVVEKLLSLFEMECGIDRLSNASVVTEDESLAQRLGVNSLADRQHHEQGGGLLPVLTNVPLVVGSFKVDDLVKTAFARQLLQIHFEKQLATISELDRYLAQGTKDVSYKVICELLLDIHRRTEYIHGLIVLI